MSWRRRDEARPDFPRKVPEPEPGWRVVDFDGSGDVWLHIPDEPIEREVSKDKKEAA